MYEFSVLWSGKYFHYWENDPHSHSFYQIIVALKSGGQIMIGGKTIPIIGQQMFFIHPHIPHSVLRDSSNRTPQLMDIKFTVSDPQLTKDLEQISAVPNVDYSLIQPFFDNILRESGANTPYSYNCVCYYFGLALMTLLRSQQALQAAQPENGDSVRGQQCGGVNLMAVLQFIQENYVSPISLDDLAKFANVSKSTLIQAFKIGLDTTPIQYINHIRLSKAKELLLTSNSNISEISEMVGFQSLHYFSRYFKKHENISPIEYRQRFSSSHFYTYRQPNRLAEMSILKSDAPKSASGN